MHIYILRVYFLSWKDYFHTRSFKNFKRTLDFCVAAIDIHHESFPVAPKFDHVLHVS